MQNAESAPASQEQSATEVSGWTINLAGVTVSNALFEMDDKQAGSFTKLYDVSLNLLSLLLIHGQLRRFAASGENNQQKFSAKRQC